MNLLEPEQLTPAPTQQPKNKTKLYFFIFACLTLVVILVFRHITITNWPPEDSSVTLQPKKSGFFRSVKNFIFQSDGFVEGQEEDRINILLFGIGGPGHDGPYLSDTNIIVSIKPSTKEVAMVSIPRDLGVNIPRHGWRKINSANSFGEAENPGGGGDFAREIFSDTFNLDIPYYVRVDFEAFVELIDAVGGLTIDVPRSFTDELFPGPNDSYEPVRFVAGVQVMDGKRALTYARSRHGNNGEGSDFARSRRQQQILTALKDKLLSAGTYTNPVRVQQILSSLSNHISTNLDVAQMMYLASLGKDASDSIKTLVLDDSPNGYLIHTTGESGAFILSPKTGNFDAISSAIASVFDTATTTATLTAQPRTTSNAPVFPSVVIEIKNGTWRAGLAAELKKKLEEKGFSVGTIGNSFKRPLPRTTAYITDPAVSKEVTETLTKTLSLPIGTVLPDWLKESYDDPYTTENEAGPKFDSATDILILLGEDYRE